MANGKTDYLEEKILNHVLTGTAYTSPNATLHIGLISATTDAEAGTFTELTGNGYARQPVAFDAWAAGISDNTSIETFTAAGGPWAQITGHVIYDALTTGNALWYEDGLTGPTLADGDSYEFAAGAFDITET